MKVHQAKITNSYLQNKVKNNRYVKFFPLRMALVKAGATSVRKIHELSLALA